MKEDLIIKKEKVLSSYGGVAGGERQHFSVITVLLLSVYLCGTIFYFCYSTSDYYRGSHYCDLIWMPHLGNILEFTVAPFSVKNFSHFQIFSIKRYGTVPTCYYVAAENLLGKLCMYNVVIKS